MDKSSVLYACSILFVSLNMGNHLFLCEFVHLYTEIDEDNEAYTTDVRIDHSTKSQSNVDAVCKNWHEENENGGTSRMVNKMMERIIITHENGKCIMSWYG